MAAMAQVQNALRAEIRDLKVQIVSLETTEADNHRLKKEIASMKTRCEDDKAKQELDFLNRLAEMAREKDTQVADLEAQLKEIQQNQAQEKLVTSDNSQSELQLEHQREIAQIVNRNKDEVDLLQTQLRVVQTKRDELTRKLEQAVVELDLVKQRKQEAEVTCGGNMGAAEKSSSMELKDMQRKLQEANEEIRQLKEQNSSDGLPDGDAKNEIRRLERENLMLRKTVTQYEQDRTKQDITAMQLERRNHDLKMTIQRLEIKGQNGNTDTRATYGFSEDAELEIECQRLQSELRRAQDEIKTANLKQEELGYELRKASTANVECSPDVDLLEQRNLSLQLACEKLEGEVEEMKKKLQKVEEQNSSLVEEFNEAKRDLQSSDDEKNRLASELSQTKSELEKTHRKEDNPQERTSNMIRQMEQNLKRETVNNETITAKFRQQNDDGTKSTDCSNELVANLREENRKLNGDVNHLQRKLDEERKLSRSLRDQRTNLSDGNVLGGRASFSSPTSAKAQVSSRMTNQSSSPSTRGSVRGIAARFENSGKQAQTDDKPTPRASFSKKPTEQQQAARSSFSKKTAELTEEVKGLKRDLEIERRQVIELEEELTRQCEINGSLLKEINDLSVEMESKRLENARSFKNSIQQQKEETDALQSLVKTLENDLSDMRKEKGNLEAKYQADKENLSSLQNEINEKTKIFSKSQSQDEETINRLQAKVQSLEKDLASTLTLVEDLRDKLNAQAEGNSKEEQTQIQNMKIALHERENRISEMTREKEAIVLSMNDMSGFHKQEIQVLQAELTRMKAKNAEQVREMESLKDKLDQRNYNIQRIATTDDKAANNLKMENNALRQRLIEATSERQTAEAKLKHYLSERGASSKSVQILRERNAALKFEVEKLTKKLSKLNDGGQTQVTRVMI